MTLAKSKGLYDLLEHRRRTGTITKKQYEEELKILKQQYPELKQYLLSQKNRNTLKIS